ncbi:tyrosine-type recombinase/integrase [Rhizobium laguerreae]
MRNYLAGHFNRQSSATSKVMSSRLRTFLRFVWIANLTAKDLAPAIPNVRNFRLAALPSFMNADQLELVLKACDRKTTAGRRDFAVLLLLSRLGLRASEVAFLALDDIDWRSGLLRVKGKGGRLATMPLPQDVGVAISDYIMGGRPASGSRVIFHRVETPCTPFRTATPVILTARRALNRAKISGTRSRHAHLFRHSFATIALRSGASLTELAQVLRHKDPDTTRIYAKVDIETLRSLSQPWPGAAGEIQ